MNRSPSGIDGACRRVTELEAALASAQAVAEGHQAPNESSTLELAIDRLRQAATAQPGRRCERVRRCRRCNRMSCTGAAR